MGARDSGRLLDTWSLLGLRAVLAALLLLGLATGANARRISVDFGANNDTGDAWAFDSTDCGVADTTAEHSCGLTYDSGGIAGPFKLGFSIKIGDTTYDELYVSKYGFVTFGIPFAIDDGAFVAATDIAGVQDEVSPELNRPFIAPFYSNLTIPDRSASEFNLFDSNSNFVGGSSDYRATSDPTPSDPANRVPAFAVTWVDLDASPDTIYTQLVIYKNGDSGNWFLRFRYGNNQPGGDEDQYNTGSTPQGVGGFSLETTVVTDTVQLANPLGGLEPDGVTPKDYFFSIVDGHVSSDTTPADGDSDGVPDSTDNCPNVSNPLQGDLDGDGIGDLCDTDRDGDGVPNVSDNCAIVPNADQADLDGDLIGNVCDADRDGDTVPNTTDNCPNVVNAGQVDSDHDGIGDACDSTPTARKCDADFDSDVDYKDLELILRALGRSASGPADPRDYDRNGRIQFFDLLKCSTQCTRTFCAAR